MGTAWLVLWLVLSTSGAHGQAWRGELSQVKIQVEAGQCPEAMLAAEPLLNKIPAAEHRSLAELHWWRAVCASGAQADSLAFICLQKSDFHFQEAQVMSGELFARSQAELGKYYYRKADEPALSKKHLERSLSAWLSLPSPDSSEIATVMEYIGKNASRMAAYNRALEMLNKSREISVALGGGISTLVALTDMNIGNTYYRMDDLPNALAYYESALKTVRQSEPGRDYTIASLLNNIAAVQDQLQMYQKAIDNYLEALYLTRRKYGDGHYNTIMTFGNIGLVYHRMGNEREALKYMSKSAGMAGKMFGPKDPRTGMILGDFAFVQAETGHYDRALELLQGALFAAAPASIARDWRSNPDIEDVLQHDLFRNTITYKAHVLCLLADTASRPEPFLRLAMDCYDLFAASLDQVWQEFSDPGDKLYLNKNGVNEYEKAIRCAARLWEVTGEESWKAKVFEFMERGKCQVQLESIRRSRASYLAKIPEPVRMRGVKLREEVNDLFYRQSVGDPDSGRLVRSPLIEKRLELDQFNDSLKSVYPGYAEMTGQKSLIPLSMVQERFTDASTCIVEYFLGDSSLYVVGLSKQGNTFREAALPVGFADSLRLFFRYMQYPHPISEALTRYSDIGLRLYQLLLEPELRPLPPEVNRLRIIPDGLLSLLPFEALPRSQGPSHPRSHGELPLLIFDYRISYSGSASLLSGVKPPANEPVECLGFAWSGDEKGLPEGANRLIQGQEWPPLPGAAKEVRAIRRMIKGNYYAAAMATESGFKENAGQYGLLHLALHGYSGGEEPFILFPGPPDSLDDGVLYLHELYNLPLQARLAVLSACETGSGMLQRGEGVMSVASGFGNAGCPSVVMSVWPVDDQAGSRIMGSFYEGLLEGLPVDEALHRAKLAFMRSGGSYRTAPYYWAPFFALGDMAPIQVSRKNRFPWGWVIGGGVVLLLLLGGLSYRKAKRS